MSEPAGWTQVDLTLKEISLASEPTAKVWVTATYHDGQGNYSTNSGTTTLRINEPRDVRFVVEDRR
jgi:hypothetical protein